MVNSNLFRILKKRMAGEGLILRKSRPNCWELGDYYVTDFQSCIVWKSVDLNELLAEFSRGSSSIKVNKLPMENLLPTTSEI